MTARERAESRPKRRSTRFRLSHYRRSERGAVAVQVALTMLALIGLASLGTEVTYLLLNQRQAQAAAHTMK